MTTMPRCTICGRPSSGSICQLCADPIGDMYRQVQEPLRSLHEQLDASRLASRATHTAMEAVQNDLLRYSVRDQLRATETISSEIRKAMEASSRHYNLLRSSAEDSLRAVGTIPRATQTAMAMMSRSALDDALSVTRAQDKLLSNMLASLQPPKSAALEVMRHIDQWSDRVANVALQPKALFEVQTLAEGVTQSLTKQLQALQSLPKLPDPELLRDRLGLETLADQMRAFNERAYRDWRTLGSTGFDTLLDSVAKATSFLQSVDIEAQDEGLTVDGVSVDWGEIEKFLAGDERPREISLETLPQVADQERDPKRRAWYVTLLLWLLQSVLVALLVSAGGSRLERIWYESTGQQKASARVLKAAAEERAARIGIPAHALQSLRFVTASTLVVRAKPTRQSQRLAELHLGDVVTFERRSKRSWALVVWSPAGDARVRGWVCARYLKKLQLPSAGTRSDNESIEPEEDPELLVCE